MDRGFEEGQDIVSFVPVKARDVFLNVIHKELPETGTNGTMGMWLVSVRAKLVPTMSRCVECFFDIRGLF